VIRCRGNAGIWFRQVAARRVRGERHRAAQRERPRPGGVGESRAGSGLSVDVVPVLYEGEPNDVGCLVSKGTGEKLRTSVRQHLDFIRGRKNQYPSDLAQLIRFSKCGRGSGIPLTQHSAERPPVNRQNAHEPTGRTPMPKRCLAFGPGSCSTPESSSSPSGTG
jgi:hypothetical protein